MISNIENGRTNSNGQAYYAYSNEPVQANQGIYRREKRYINDLEDVFHREMVDQDENNFRDCQCRIIRGSQDCIDCNMQAEEHINDLFDSMPSQMIENSLINNHNRKIRSRRDVSEIEMKQEVEENQTFDGTTTSVGQGVTEANEKVTKIDAEILNNGKETIIGYNSTTEKDEHTSKVDATTSSLGEIRGKETVDSAKQIEKLEERTNGELSSEEKPNESPTVNAKDQLKLESDNDKKVATRLPRKVSESQSKLVLNPGIKSNADLKTGSNASTANKQVGNIQDYQVPSTVSFAPKVSANQKETDSSSQRKREQEAGTQTTLSSISKFKNLTSKNPKNILATINSNTKQESDSTKNMEGTTKTRQTRLTTRAEALAALRKENESRRAKKMIESSMKIISNEAARFAEHQKKRHEQLERLQTRLRIKREKMLQQYREELLEAIKDSSDIAVRKLRRRDVTENYKRSAGDDMRSNVNSNSEELTDIMEYKPVRYTENEKSRYDERYTPMVEIIRPYEEAWVQTRRNQAQDHDYTSKTGYSVGESKNSKLFLGDQLKDAEVLDTTGEQDWRVLSSKRSYRSIDGSANEKALNRNPGAPEENNAEYHSQDRENLERGQYRLPEYYPDFIYYGEDSIPSPVDEQYPYYFYDIDHVIAQQPHIGEDDYDMNLSAYERFEQGPAQRNFEKSKESDSKVLEIDPSVHGEDKSEPNLQNFVTKPASLSLLGKYRDDPHTNSRRRREAALNMNDESDGPLFFTLGLEESKLKSRRNKYDTCKYCCNKRIWTTIILCALELLLWRYRESVSPPCHGIG